eukprot:2664403-Pyramimonas_sp.AAC.1
MPLELRPFFALPPVPGPLPLERGVPARLGGIPRVLSEVTPRLRSVPMGWTWATRLAQRAHIHQI